MLLALSAPSQAQLYVDRQSTEFQKQRCPHDQRNRAGIRKMDITQLDGPVDPWAAPPDAVDLAAEREARALEFMDEIAPRPPHMPQALTISQLARAVEQGDKFINRRRTARLKTMRAWWKLVELGRVAAGDFDSVKAAGILAQHGIRLVEMYGSIEYRQRRAAALAIRKMQRWNPNSTEDRARRARRRVNRAKRLALLIRMREQFIPCAVALRVCDMSQRCLNDHMATGHIQRKVIENRVYVAVSGLRRYLEGKIRA